jgi:protein-tyrosine-phosphatase
MWLFRGTKMNDRVYNVLFLCTGNSARSILAECIMNREGAGRFKGYSAGSMPKGEVLPEIKRFLEHMNQQTDDLRSKSWEEFATDGAPVMDFVFTVCDNAAGEVCPIWPGQPMSAHWGVPDPATFEGTEAEKAAFIADVYRMLANRIGIFVNLPIASLDKLTLQKHLESIGAGKSEMADA